MKDRGKVVCPSDETREQAISRGINRLNKDKLDTGFPIGYCSVLDKYSCSFSNMIDNFYITYGKMSGQVSRRAKFLIAFANKIERIV